MDVHGEHARRSRSTYFNCSSEQTGPCCGGTDWGANTGYDSVELYNPSTGIWTTSTSMGVRRSAQTATLLQTGKVVVASGLNETGVTTSSELFDPSTNAWTP